jgi:peroxiredoxin
MSFMTAWRRLVVVFGALCLTAGVVSSNMPQSSYAAPPDVQTLGPQVGSQVPEFTLRDQQGETRTLKSLMGPKGLMLVFFRSADWCPFCKTQLADLETKAADLKRDGLGLAAVSYDAVPVLADFSKRRHITYPLLSDAGSVVIRRYGILNTTVPESSRQAYGIPFPGTFILNPQGVVTARFFEQAYEERNSVGSLLVRLGEGIDVPATKISSPQIQITSYATDQTVALGTHFSLVLDITPGPLMHVYAPGVVGYKAIGLTIRAQPGMLIREARYPKPEDYFFQPLNEHVAVYQRPFRVVQDLAVDASAGGRVGAEGRLQAQYRGDAELPGVR